MTRKAHTLRLAVASGAIAALLIVPVAAAGDPGPDAVERAVNARTSMANGKLSELALSARMAGPNFSQTSNVAAGPDAVERAVNARTSMGNGKLSELALSARMAGPNFSQTPVAAPDAFERAVNAHNASLGTISSPGRAVPDVVGSIGSTTVTASTDAFDWSSAAIGGSAMLALVLLVSGGALVTRHSRGRVALR